ncbi:MAG: hypothetical protein ACW97P_11660 [Candidatus Hodarchaeales archaeon]|jgi:hypothetical protein
MNNGKKTGQTIDKDIERFCQGTEKVLTKIHDRIGEEEARKQKKKKKKTAA